MKKIAIAALVALLFGMPAFAQPAQKGPAGQLSNSVPAGSISVADYSKGSVYDSSNNKIGEVEDLLVAKDGKITTYILGVGGFLEMGEKHVAVPFDLIQLTKKDNKPTLVMNATKDGLKAAPGFTYNKTTTSWEPAKK